MNDDSEIGFADIDDGTDPPSFPWDGVTLVAAIVVACIAIFLSKLYPMGFVFFDWGF